MLDVMLWLNKALASCLFVIRVAMGIDIACYYFNRLVFCKIDIGSDI
jgi:hypothetical protein